MTITYFRSPHKPEALNERFGRLLKKADIIFLEQAMGDAYNLAYNHYNQLSFRGYSKLDVEHEFFGDFQRKEESFIRGCKRPIEIERSQFSTKEIHMPMNMIFYSYLSFFDGNLEDACKLKQRSARCSAEINSTRDDAIGKQLESLQKANRNKNILALMGGSHEFQINLDKKGIKVKQEFPYKPYPFGLEDQLERCLRFGKTPTKEIVARSFVGNIIHGHLEKIGIRLPDNITGGSNTAEQLPYKDIEALSKHLGSTVEGSSGSTQAVINWLENNGIKIYHK